MSSHEGFDLRSYVFVIRRRKWLVVWSVVVFMGLAFLLNATTAPVYRTSARLEINQLPSRSPLTGEAVGNPSPLSENLALFTTTELITNRSLLERLAATLRARGVVLGQEKVSSKLARYLQRLLATVRGANQDFRGASVADIRTRRDVDWLLKAISVRPVRDTRLVDIQAEHFDPRVAAEIANAIAMLFVDYEADRRRGADTTRLEYLKGQIQDLKRVIQSSEQTLYGSHEASLTLLEGRRKQLTDIISELNVSFVRTKSDRLAVEAQLKRVRAFGHDSGTNWNDLPIETPAVNELRRALQKAETELAQARQVYREHHPRLIALQSQCQSARGAIEQELQKVASDLAGQSAVLAAGEENLKRALAEHAAEMRSLSDQTYKYSTLESELATDRDLYTLLLKKSQEQGIAQTIEPPLVQLVEPAMVPLYRARPRRTLNVALGLIIGLVVGAGSALALEAMRRTIRTPRDVVHELHLPVLGMLPKRL